MRFVAMPTGTFVKLSPLLVASVAGTFLTLIPTGLSAANVNELISQGRRETREKRYDAAVGTFSAALQMNSDAKTAAEILAGRGNAYVEKGNLDKAMADAEAALRSAPRYFRGYQLRGRVYRHRQKFDRALADLDLAMKLAPDFVQLFNNRGNVYSDMGRRERAIQDYSEAIRRAPGTIDGYVNRGGEYVLVQQFDRAIADLDQALRIDPRDSDSYFNRARAHSGKKNYLAAIADYTKANQLSPHDPETLNGIAWLRATCPVDSVRNGKDAVQASLEACQLANFKEPNHVDTLAAAYAEAGDFDRAIEYMTKVLGGETDSSHRREFEARLALYRDRKPYRDVAPVKAQAQRK